MLMAQQQQQQQRQLHDLLLQLLAVHKLGTNDVSPLSTVGPQESPLHVKAHGMLWHLKRGDSQCHYTFRL